MLFKDAFEKYLPAMG